MIQTELFLCVGHLLPVTRREYDGGLGFPGVSLALPRTGAARLSADDLAADRTRSRTKPGGKPPAIEHAGPDVVHKRLDKRDFGMM